VLDREQRHHLVVAENNLAVRAEDEADVEEAPRKLWMTRLRLRHQVRVPLPGQPAKVIGLGTRDVDRAFPGELLVVEVQNLVVEALQRAFGDRDEPDRQVQAGQPRCGLDQVRQVLEVRRDLIAVTDASHGGYQA